MSLRRGKSMILKSKVFSGLCGFKGFVLVMPVMDVRALPRVILLLMGPAMLSAVYRRW